MTGKKRREEFDREEEDIELLEEEETEEEEIEEYMEENSSNEVVSVYYEAPPEDTEVIGIRFRSSGKVYFFDPDGITYPEGVNAVVETARGQEYGLVVQTNHIVPGKEIVLPLRKAVRIATPEDDLHNKENLRKSEEAFLIGNKKIAEHRLDMKLIDTEYTFDNTKLLFYFTSDGRVDFRELVKDLASVFRCRIELRQMGIRDEAKVLGGLGTCGRPFCCHAFLPDFVQVSIKMAKEQNLSLNSAKISGACGRLMCCLRYEYDTYLEEGRRTPKVDSLVNTPDGIGVVVESKPLVGLVKVRSLSEDSAVAPKVYHRDDLSPIKKGDENYEKALEEKTLEKTARAKGMTRAALKQAAKEEEEGKEEKPVRPIKPVRPAPQRAAFYSDQVMPAALAPKAEESKVKVKEQPEEEAETEEKRFSKEGRGRRKFGKTKPKMQYGKPEGAENAAGEEREAASHVQESKDLKEQKDQRGQRNRHKKGGNRPERPAEAPVPEQAAVTEKAPRYEKVTKQQSGGNPQNAAKGKEITVNRKESGENPAGQETKKSEHKHRPFYRKGNGKKN